MKKPEIIKLAKTKEELVQEIANAINYFDTLIFDEPLQVEIANGIVFQREAAAMLLEASWFSKLFGDKDKYLVFSESEHLDEILGRPFGVIAVALHEVRHRYQKMYKHKLISQNYVRDHSLHFDPRTIDKYVSIIGKHKKEIVRKYEFDAMVIEWVFFNYYRKIGMTTDVVIELITCNESSLLKIISRLKYDK